jgi:hypothetical protein
MADGRVFDKCFECYHKSFTKCEIEICNNKTFNGTPLCSSCYKTSKFNKKVSPSKYENCKTTGCKNTTTYSYCKDCNYKKKNITDNYMTFSCQKCGTRGRGDYKFCGMCD